MFALKTPVRRGSESHYICTVSNPVVENLVCCSRKMDGKPREGKNDHKDFIITEKASPKLSDRINVTEFVHLSLAFV